MNKAIFLLFYPVAIALFCSSCGTTVPAKNNLRSDVPVKSRSSGLNISEQGAYESSVLSHIACEIGLGLSDAQQFELPWLNKWGTAVTLTMTAQDQGGFAPGFLYANPLQNAVRQFPAGGNVTIARSFSLGAGASAATTSTRTETIQFTYLNSDLLDAAKRNPNCSSIYTGVQIDGDLKLRQFVFDKALIARSGNASLYSSKSKGFKATNFKRPDVTWEWPVFNTITEDVTFLAAYGGSLNPTWKLTNGTVDPSGSLLSAERTLTNDMIVTMGPVHPPTEDSAAALDSAAQAQHNARVTANALATSTPR